MTDHNNVGRRRRTRVIAVVAAVIVAVIIWAVAEGAGLHLKQPSFSSAQRPQSLAIPFVIVVPALASLLGWALLAALERWTPRPRATWTTIAVIVLLLSFSLPFSGTGVTMANRVTLLLMHIAVGLVVIPTMASTSLSRRLAAEGPGSPARASAGAR